MRLHPMTTGECDMNESDQNKIKILRRLLEMKTRDEGRRHSETRAFAGRLARLLDEAGDPVGCLTLYTEYTVVDLDNADSAIPLNSLALDWRKIGRPHEAELLLRQAREIENRLLARDATQHPHRLNNLSTVLIMQDKLEEAKTLVRQAWALMKGRHDTTSVRIQISRLTISLLESKPSGVYIGRLKTLLEMPPSVAGNITATTGAAVTIDYLKPRLSSGDYEFLHALYRAANDPAEVDKLGEFEQWRQFEPVKLELSIQEAGPAG